jgi:hypothetical protein
MSWIDFAFIFIGCLTLFLLAGTLLMILFDKLDERKWERRERDG